VFDMSVWGIASRIDRHEILVIGVDLVGPREVARGSEVLRHRSDPRDDWAQKLVLMANDFEAQLTRMQPTAVVVRSLDRPPAASREGFARSRYQVEGVLLEVARRHVKVVRSQSGLAIAQTLGASKQAVQAEAMTTLGHLDNDAAIAGLAALVLGLDP
jgi:hypothetical protein